MDSRFVAIAPPRGVAVSDYPASLTAGPYRPRPTIPNPDGRIRSNVRCDHDPLKHPITMPKRVITMDRNRRSRCSETGVHDGPKRAPCGQGLTSGPQASLA